MITVANLPYTAIVDSHDQSIEHHDSPGPAGGDSGQSQSNFINLMKALGNMVSDTFMSWSIFVYV